MCPLTPDSEEIVEDIVFEDEDVEESLASQSSKPSDRLIKKRKNSIV